MPTELLKKPRRPRRPKAAVAATAAAVTGVMVFLAAQGIGSAAAGTVATRSDYLEGCSTRDQACLWINAPDDPNPAKAADRRALVITPGSGPDISDTTPYGKGKVHGLTEEFTDNISNGWNHLSYDLCLMDTALYDDESFDYKLRTSTFIMVVKPKMSFTQLDDWNDKIDYYSTAPTGKCPRGGVIFRTDTQEIIKSW
jgi:hypothetical protein